MLNSEESAKLVRVAGVVERADAVFEDRAVSIDWLNSPNSPLSEATPLSLLDTDMGAESVMATLGHIEHGVFAFYSRRENLPAQPASPLVCPDRDW